MRCVKKCSSRRWERSGWSSAFNEVVCDLGLVLVRTKFHTVALEEYLNKQPELIQRGIAVGHLTGQGSAEELCLPGSQQMTVLNQFRKGKLEIRSVLVRISILSGVKSLLVATGEFMFTRSSRWKHLNSSVTCRCGSGRAGCSWMLVCDSIWIRLERDWNGAESWTCSGSTEQVLSDHGSL